LLGIPEDDVKPITEWEEAKNAMLPLLLALERKQDEGRSTKVSACDRQDLGYMVLRWL
jgi:hypothetical protein